MFRRALILYIIVWTIFAFTGCNKGAQSIYELSVGDVMHKAIKVQVTSYSTELDNKSKVVTSAKFKLSITNVGIETIDLEKDIIITAMQGEEEALLITNTIIESQTLESEKLGTYEIGFNFIGKGNAEINFEIGAQKEGFKFTTIHPATISE